MEWIEVRTRQNLGWGLGNWEWDILGATVYDFLSDWTLTDEQGFRVTSSRPKNARRPAALFQRRLALPANAEIWQRSLDAASRQEVVPDEHRLLRDGEEVIDRRQFRRAVIDAGTAVELALTNALDKQIADANLAKALLDKYRMLGGRIELAKKLSIPVPSNIEMDLVRPRNSAVHGYAPLNQATAEVALEVAREVVHVYVPL